MNLNSVIASNLKRLRQERNLSLGQLAELSGVSKVMLGQIEKGDSNPTINMLWKIANGLKVPYTQLIDEPESEAELLPKERRTEQNDAEGQYRIFTYFSSTPRRNFELFLIELDPGAEHGSVPHSEKSQEYVLIQEGCLRLSVGGREYELNPEDSICFSAAAPHTYANLGNTVAKAVVIIYYPG